MSSPASIIISHIISNELEVSGSIVWSPTRKVERIVSIQAYRRLLLPMLQPRVFPILAELLRLANKQCVEERAPRLRTRDGGLAAAAYGGDQQGRLESANWLSDFRKRRDGFRRQEVDHRGMHVVARPEGDEGSTMLYRGGFCCHGVSLVQGSTQTKAI